MIPLNPGCALFNSVNALCNVSFETCPLPAALADEGTPITTWSGLSGAKYFSAVCDFV